MTLVCKTNINTYTVPMKDGKPCPEKDGGVRENLNLKQSQPVPADIDPVAKEKLIKAKHIFEGATAGK